jgi:hypothetical protein
MDIDLQQRLSDAESISDIFVVAGASEPDRGITELTALMGKHGLLFYKSASSAGDQGPTGLLAHDDTIIIKVNCQWDERGGTNTDLLKALIQTILQHPDHFTGEIVVADNGQGRYGAHGYGGSLSYRQNNADNLSQSIQDVVNSFDASNLVSTYLWDTITTKRVTEYSEGDEEDGYVIDTKRSQETGAMVSYPKFKTKFGTLISFKLGIWDPGAKTYDSRRLKVINMPVLKSHGGFGVTGCVKHYMGVSSDQLTSRLGASIHSTVGTGGMGTEIAGTRYPALNIMDAIWINANPGEGPRTTYDVATRTDLILASTDPVALDYWAAKHVLLQAARSKGHRNIASMDPDNQAHRSFGEWLQLSMNEIMAAGYTVTVDENHMNIYVVHM